MISDFAVVLQERLNALAGDLERVHSAEVASYQREIDRLKADLRNKELDWLDERKRLMGENQRINALYQRAVDLAQKRSSKRSREETSVENEPPAKKQRPASSNDAKSSPVKSDHEMDVDDLNETVQAKIKLEQLRNQEDDLIIVEKPLTKTPSKGVLEKADLFADEPSPTRKSPTSDKVDPGRTPPLGSLKKSMKPLEPLPPRPVSINLADDDSQEKKQLKPLPSFLLTPQQKVVKRVPLTKTPSNTSLPKTPVAAKPSIRIPKPGDGESDDQLLALAEAANPTFKYQEERVYGKDRAKLPAHECAECEAFYNAFYEGDENNPERQRQLQRCGRHRTLFAAPSTPPGYWDVDFNSQEEARKKKASAAKRGKTAAPVAESEDSF